MYVNLTRFLWFRFFVIAMAIVTGYLILAVPFSIVCIARPAAIGPRLLLIICDTVRRSHTSFCGIYIN